MENYSGHQGDVYFNRVSDSTCLAIGDCSLDMSTFEKTLEKLGLDEKGGITIIEGEATAHHHRVADPGKVTVYKAANMDRFNTFLVVVKEDTTLEHHHMKEDRPTGEHNPVPLKKGLYIMRSQRQADLEGQIFPVID